MQILPPQLTFTTVEPHNNQQTSKHEVFNTSSKTEKTTKSEVFGTKSEIQPTTEFQVLGETGNKIEQTTEFQVLVKTGEEIEPTTETQVLGSEVQDLQEQTTEFEVLDYSKINRSLRILARNYYIEQKGGLRNTNHLKTVVTPNKYDRVYKFCKFRTVLSWIAKLIEKFANHKLEPARLEKAQQQHKLTITEAKQYNNQLLQQADEYAEKCVERFEKHQEAKCIKEGIQEAIAGNRGPQTLKDNIQFEIELFPHRVKNELSIQLNNFFNAFL